MSAGTIFHGTRTPLTVWFSAAWFITSPKDGASALGLQRVLGLGSYATAWAMLHRLRTAMARPARSRLSGDVEVDETFIGGPRPGTRGRGATGKTIVMVAVEHVGTSSLGRCRMQVVANTKIATLARVIRANVEPGSVVLTDGHQSYPRSLTDCTHKPPNISASGRAAHVDLPGAHRAASQLKRWMMSTCQGSVQPERLRAYLDEFCFRLNRRTSAKRGMLFYRLLVQSLATPGVTEAQRLARTLSTTPPTTPPVVKHVHAGSLDIRVRTTPWRRSTVVQRSQAPDVSKEPAEVCHRRSSVVARSCPP